MWVEEALTTKLVGAFIIAILAGVAGAIAATVHLHSVYGVDDWVSQLKFAYGQILINAFIGGAPLAGWCVLLWRRPPITASVCGVAAIWAGYAWYAIFGEFRGYEALAVGYIVTMCSTLAFALFSSIRFRWTT